MRKEGVNPKHLIGAAVDFVSFFAHKKDGRIDDSKSSLEMKQMKMAGVDKIASLCYIGAFRHKQPTHLLNSSNMEVKHGDRFPMFENKTAWHSNSLHKGANIELERTVTATAKQVDLYIEHTSLLAAFGTCACACVLMSLVGLPSSLDTLIES
jgi:hypothetical protein